MKLRYIGIITFFALSTAMTQILAHERHANAMAKAIAAKDEISIDTTTDLMALKEYAESHTAVSVKVFLSGSYNRAVQAAQSASSPQSNGQIYAAAQAACAGRADSVSQARCVTAYVNSHAQPSTNPQAVSPPDREAFTRTFKSTSWRADSVGVALLVAALAIAFGVYTATKRRY